MRLLNFVFVSLVLIVFTACERDLAAPYTPTLAPYIAEDEDFETSPDLIACAAGVPSGFMGDTLHPTSVFFDPA